MVKSIDKSFLRQNWFIRASWNNKKNCISRQEMDKEKRRKANTEQGTVRYCERSQAIQRARKGERNAESINKNTEKEIEKS